MYAKRLEAQKEGGGEEMMKRMTENWKENLGKIQCFPDYLSFFTQQYQLLDLVPLLHTYLGELVPGMWRAAFHCLIELGFGLLSSHPPSVVRGLAYLAASFQHLSTDLENLMPTKCPHGETEWDLFDFIRSDPSFSWPLLFPSQSGFQSSMKHLQSTPSLLAQYKLYCQWFAHLLLSPSRDDVGHCGDNFNGKGEDSADISSQSPRKKTNQSKTLSSSSSAPSSLVASRLRFIVMKLFVFTGGNDFFLLHGVTAFHALLPCLLYLPSETLRLNALLHFAYFLLAVYLVQGVKQVTRTLPPHILDLLPASLLSFSSSLPLEPTPPTTETPKTLVLQPNESIQPTTIPSTSTLPLHPSFARDAFLPYWNQLIKRVVEDYEDEHVIKLTWVAKWNFDRLLDSVDFNPLPQPPLSTLLHDSSPQQGKVSPITVETIAPSLLFFLSPTLCSHLVSPSGQGWVFH